MADFLAVNRDHWDDRAEAHARSRYYDLAAVVAHGPARIAGPDEDEVGPVAGRSLLHLHCHIGTDSLRWAALGADVTGVDLSGRSVRIARDLAARLGLAAAFVEADVHDLPGLPGLLDRRFDIVYASYGVICWVPDMDRWARVAAGFVRPGGFLYLAEGHPIDLFFDPGRFGRTGYFDRGPRRYVDHHSYTDGDDPLARPENYRWAHTLGDVVTAVARAGLRIEFLHEHPAPAGPGGQDDAGRAERRRLVPAGAPALFSLRARAG